MDQLHVLALYQEQRVTPGGPYIRCRCSCGYRSRLESGRGARSRAKKAGVAHRDAKLNHQRGQE